MVEKATTLDSVITKTKVKAGVEGALTTKTGTIAYNTSETPTQLTDAEKIVSKNLEIQFDDTKFNDTGAGVYRYKITENSHTNTNITDLTGNDAFRYIDVYVQNKSDGTGLEITGFVVTKKDTSDVIKTDGFVDEYTPYQVNTDNTLTAKASESNGTISTYNTYDLEILKNVAGDLGDKSYQFEFNVDFTSTQDFDNDIKLYTKYGTDSASRYETSVSGKALKIQNIKLSHGKSVTIKGIPVTMSTYTVSEKKHNTDTYSVQYRVNSDNEGDFQAINTLTDTIWYKTGMQNALLSNVAGADKVEFKNTLASVSPTGLVFKIMPYIIMIALALVLGYVYLGRRNKANE